MKKALIVAALVALVSACSSIPDHAPPNQVFCAKYFIYDMCVEDLDIDGQVDVMYFADDGEVFMRRPDIAADELKDFPMHACVQEMDEKLTDAGTELLYLTPETGFFKRTEIESGLLMQYSRYSGRINDCRREKGLMEPESEEDDFIDFEDDYADGASASN